MKKRFMNVMAIVVALSMVFIAGPVMANGNDDQTVNYSVTAINEIDIAAGAMTLTVNSATAGSAPDQATDSSTYNITTNVTSPATKKITAALAGTSVTGLTFGIHVEAPSTGTNVAAAELIAGTPRDVVEAISAVNESALVISYTLDATVLAGVVSSESKIVTLTIADS